MASLPPKPESPVRDDRVHNSRSDLPTARPMASLRPHAETYFPSYATRRPQRLWDRDWPRRTDWRDRRRDDDRSSRRYGVFLFQYSLVVLCIDLPLRLPQVQVSSQPSVKIPPSLSSLTLTSFTTFFFWTQVKIEDTVATLQASILSPRSSTSFFPKQNPTSSLTTFKTT